ncbi:hypothetical protein [Streptomyces tendae]|uniref:hypothetical protein n=1 Tax=Streptomyces tendae TaxID=1932 RepID=UPI0037237200
MGLKAAARELGRPVGEMGNPARGAGRTGASRPMTVNEAVLALLRPMPDLTQLAKEPADIRAAAQAAVDAPAGLGTIASYATEVPLLATGTWANPGKGGAQADIVITAPEDGVPLLFVKIDNCFESAQVLAGKIDKYMRFGQRKVKDVDGKERPMWRTRWWVPDGRHGDRPHPPLLLVFNRIGPRNPDTVMAQLAELTERHWKGTAYEGGFHMYDGKLPIVVTRMKQLKELARPERSSGPSAGRTSRRSSRRSAIRAAKRPTLASVPNTMPASASTRHSCAASPHSTGPSGRPAVPCVPAAAPVSPTNGGRPSSPPGGTPRARPTRTCATTASTKPSPPNATPSRPGPRTRSTTRPYRARRPAAHGSPTSAHDGR